MGTPKGRLRVPGGDVTIIEALVRRAREAGLRPVLVGEAAEYSDLVPDVPRVADDPAGAGPLGGLCAALQFASPRPVIAVACDMPFVTVEALTFLHDHPASPVVAARRSEGAPWEPMLARYEPEAVLPTLQAALGRGVRSFQQLFKELSVERLPSEPALLKALEDWDTPEDLP